MDFILNEAVEEQEDDFKLVFSGDSEGEHSEEELDSFVCDSNPDEDGKQDAFFLEV